MIWSLSKTGKQSLTSIRGKIKHGKVHTDLYLLSLEPREAKLLWVPGGSTARSKSAGLAITCV